MAYVITLTGSSGSGKSTFLNILLHKSRPHFKPVLFPKYTTRSPRDADGPEVRCVRVLPRFCDMIYEQYGDRYGFRVRDLYDHLRGECSPIVVVNDVRVVDDLRRSLGRLTRSVFVFREIPQVENFRKLAEDRGQIDERDIRRRYEKAHSIYRIFIENIHLFDHVVLNAGTPDDLTIQASAFVNGLKDSPAWPLKPVRGR